MLYWRNGGVFVKLQVTNTSKEVLEWIKSATGVGAVNTHREETATRKKTWQWITAGPSAVSIARQVEPFLKIKQTQARLAIETDERLQIPAVKADRTWQAEYRARMKSLNARGPQPSGGAR